MHGREKIGNSFTDHEFVSRTVLATKRLQGNIVSVPLSLLEDNDHEFLGYQTNQWTQNLLTQNIRKLHVAFSQRYWNLDHQISSSHEKNSIEFLWEMNKTRFLEFWIRPKCIKTLWRAHSKQFRKRETAESLILGQKAVPIFISFAKG